MKKFILASLLLMPFATAFGSNTGSPQAVNIKFYEFWVATAPDCTGLTRVYSETNPSYQNVADNISFGQIQVPNGSYSCVGFKMSDVVKLTPDFTSDNGNCVQGTEITRDLFRSGDVALSPDGVTINGSGTNPNGQIENGMYVYLSLTGNDNNSATVPSLPGRLTNAYVVSNDNEATLVFDFTNGIVDMGTECSPEGVVFSFRYQ